MEPITIALGAVAVVAGGFAGAWHYMACRWRRIARDAISEMERAQTLAIQWRTLAQGEQAELLALRTAETARKTMLREAGRKGALVANAKRGKV